MSVLASQVVDDLFVEQDAPQPPPDPNEPSLQPPLSARPRIPRASPQAQAPPVAPVAPVRAPARPTGKSAEPWDALDPNTQTMIRAIAAAARDRQVVRIRYNPKVTTGAAVYRTVAPYSLRWRWIHVNGYDAPPELTPVFFGYDAFEGTIKMFVIDRIITVERKTKRFDPSWPVEFEDYVSPGTTLTEDMDMSRIGRCYELAGRWLIVADEVPRDATLVHGHIYSPFGNTPLGDLDHAWIEDDDTVWEPITETEYPKEVFYQLFKAKALATYTREEMREKILATEHWGPWEDDLGEQTTEPEQDVAVDQMLARYEDEPTNLWLYSNLPIKDRMALAYLSADNMMGAPFREDQVHRFIEALKMTTQPPEGFWEQIRAKDPMRAQYLDELEWSLESVPLDQIGVYPQFGGFPKEWGRGSVVDTARELASSMTDDVRRQEVLDLSTKWMTVNKFLPPVLVPGGTLRGQEPDFYEQMPHDCDDGNHRLVGAAIGGAEEVVCFVGRSPARDPDGARSESVTEQDFDQVDFGEPVERPPVKPNDPLLIFTPEGDYADEGYVTAYYERDDVARVEFAVEGGGAAGGPFVVYVPVDSIEFTSGQEYYWSIRVPVNYDWSSVRSDPEWLESVEEAERSPYYYKKFTWDVLQAAITDFWKGMENAGGDPLPATEAVVTQVIGRGKKLGLGEEQAREFALDLAVDTGGVYDESADSLTLQWQQLPEQFKMRARIYTKTLALGEQADFDQIDFGDPQKSYPPAMDDPVDPLPIEPGTWSHWKARAISNLRNLADAHHAVIDTEDVEFFVDEVEAFANELYTAGDIVPDDEGGRDAAETIHDWLDDQPEDYFKDAAAGYLETNFGIAREEESTDLDELTGSGAAGAYAAPIGTSAPVFARWGTGDYKRRSLGRKKRSPADRAVATLLKDAPGKKKRKRRKKKKKVAEQADFDQIDFGASEPPPAPPRIPLDQIEYGTGWVLFHRLEREQDVVDEFHRMGYDDPREIVDGFEEIIGTWWPAIGEDSEDVRTQIQPEGSAIMIEVTALVHDRLYPPTTVLAIESETNPNYAWVSDADFEEAVT